MSSFKQLNRSDVTHVAYAANKQWNLTYPNGYPTSSEYITIYKGTNVSGSFDTTMDPVTEGQYERLIYDQINHLFYHSFSGSFLNTSSLANSELYESASQQYATASYFIYDENPNFINNFPTGTNAGIRVLAVNQDVYGNKLLPYNFRLSSSAYFITDDGNGNLFNTGSIHIGNIFYPQGLAVITNQDYQNMFPLPPLAVADIFTVRASDLIKTGSYQILNNDFARSGTLLTSSIVLSGSTNQLDIIRLTGTDNQLAEMYADIVIPSGSDVPYEPITYSNYKFFQKGTYDAYYTVKSTGNFGQLTSNKALIRFNVIEPDCEFNFRVEVIPPTPTPTPTPTNTPTQTATQTLTPTQTPTLTSTQTPTLTSTQTPSLTATQTPTLTATQTVTATQTPTLTATTTQPSTPTPTQTPTLTATRTVTPTQTPTLTATRTVTPTQTPTLTATQTVTATQTPTLTATRTVTPTQTPTLTSTPTLTATNPVMTPTATPTLTATNPVMTPTATPTLTATNPVMTPTATPTQTATNPVMTPTATNPVMTPTATNPVMTPTPTATITYVEPSEASLYFSDFYGSTAVFTLGTNNNFGLASSFTIAWAVNGYTDDTCLYSIESASGTGTYPAQQIGVQFFAKDYDGLTCSSTNFQRQNPIYINGNYVFNGQSIVLGNTTVTVLIDGDCDYYAC